MGDISYLLGGISRIRTARKVKDFKELVAVASRLRMTSFRRIFSERQYPPKEKVRRTADAGPRVEQMDNDPALRPDQALGRRSTPCRLQKPSPRD